jgi:ABC-type transport system involved in cytochrome bd biosynthesis fused ATPase/permease subunit
LAIKREKIILLITHKLNEILASDSVVFVDDGKVVQAPHDLLMENNSAYQHYMAYLEKGGADK